MAGDLAGWPQQRQVAGGVIADDDGAGRRVPVRHRDGDGAVHHVGRGGDHPGGQEEAAALAGAVAGARGDLHHAGAVLLVGGGEARR